MPSATAAIPCYNACKYLQGTVLGLRSQSTQFTEIILIDDGSTDGSAELALTLDCRVIRHDKNLGLASARNTALDCVTTELIAFIDSDVVLDSGWLKTLLPAFDNPLVAHAGGRLVESHTTSPPDAWRAMHMPQDHGTHPLTFTPDSWGRLAGFASLSKCEALRAVGRYDTVFARAYEDVDMSRRLLAAGYQMRYVPDAVAYHSRRDTISTLMASSWNWDFWPAVIDGGYSSRLALFHRIEHHLSNTVALATGHIKQRKPCFLIIDSCYLITACTWDVLFYMACSYGFIRSLFGRLDRGNIGRRASTS